MTTDNYKWKGKVRLKFHDESCSAFKDEACDCQGRERWIENTGLVLGLQSILTKLIDFSGGNSDNGFLKYLEVGTSNDVADSGQTGLVLPKSRALLTYGAVGSTTAVVKGFFNGSQANTSHTTVASSASTTIFTVSGGSGSLFNEGDLILVGTDETVIQDITGDVITVFPALSGIPGVGEDVDQLLTEIGLFGDSAASVTIGSGTPYARAVMTTPETKSSGEGLTVEWHVTLT